MFYLNSAAKKKTFAENCTSADCAYRLKLILAANQSILLTKELKKSHNVSGISGFGPPGETPQGKEFPLGWGEIIPLYFIDNLNSTKVIISSHPTRRYENSTSIILELLHLGRSLYLKLHHLPEKVVVVISGDLAHTHSKDGPYGFSPAAQPFDDAVGMWIKLDPNALLETAASFVDDARSCGFTGLVMLHGMLPEAGLKKWKSRLVVNGHPSYYGMAIGEFLKKDGEEFWE